VLQALRLFPELWALIHLQSQCYPGLSYDEPDKGGFPVRLVSVTLPLLACSLLLGQDYRATITGQVTDGSKSAIPNALVRAIQPDTNEVTQTKTNAEGYYTLGFLNPHQYVVEVTAAGFKTFRREDVVLMVADKIDLPFVLEVGQVSSEITVSGGVQGTDNADASGGVNFDTVQTSEYPLNGRQSYMLMEMATGVLFTQEQFGAAGYSGTRGWDVSGAYVMNGGVQGTNMFLLNGAPISLTGTWQISPNMEAIQEFKVMTNTYDAQYGRTGGGTVNTTIKSGANKLHGSAFDYLRNSLLDANTTQNNEVGAPRGKHITNQFGGTVGGALRKDKDFYFVSFEGFRERVPFPLVTDTPPADLRNGQNFSNYGINIFDPLTERTCVSGTDTPKGTSCFGTYIRSPFPNNAIPVSRISPIGKAILDLYPLPNHSGQTQNFFATGNDGQYAYNQPMGRWDHNIGDKDRIYAMFTFQHGHEFRNQNGFPAPAEQGNIYTQRTQQTYIADWTRILTPATVMDFRVSFGRFTSYFPDGPPNNITASSLGMTMPHPPTTNTDTAPRVQVSSYSDIIGNLYTWSTNNQWDFAPSVTHTSGTHTRRYGFEFVYAGIGTGDIGRANGLFAFNNGWTQQYADRNRNASDGSGIASLLLGMPVSGYINYNDTYYRTWPYLAGFVQDDWRVRSNLTLNLGLRYDIQIPFVERWDRVNSGFDFNSVNPLSSQVLAAWAQDKAQYDATKPKYPYPNPPAALLGGKLFVGNGPRRVYDTDFTDLQPRIGLAWAFEKHSVLRTGFGIYYRTATQSNYTDGFSQQTNYAPSFDGSITPANGGLTGPYSLQNPFPGGLVQPTGQSLGLLTNAGLGVSFDGHQRPIPRTYQYSFGLQHWFPWSVKLDVSYVGSQTVHDSMSQNMDYVSMANFLIAHGDNSYLNRKVPNPFYGILSPTTDFGKAPTFNAESLLYPYPLFNGITMSTQPWSKYRYDSLQVRMERRFFGSRRAGGLLTTVAYTFAKSFEANHRLNNWNLAEAPVHELSVYDKPQNLAISGVWDLPFGNRRALLSESNRVVRAIVSDWNYNFVFTYNAGYPTSWPNAVFTCSSYFVTNQTNDQWFNNTSGCWKGRASYPLRDTGDRFAWIRNPGRSNLNMAIARTFHLTERYAMQLRGESFNTTNTPMFGGPDTTYTDPRFGQLPIAQQNFPRLVQLSARFTF